MRYTDTAAGTFVSRPNRFIAQVELGGVQETVHVKNTGRCRELLLPAARVILSRSGNPARKTRYDLVAVWKEHTLVNIDSQAPNAAAKELLPRLFPGYAIRPETAWGASRFDFALEKDGRRAFLEVKGVTLEDGGRALFPDAPTERGVKHLRELMRAVDEGYDAYVLFLVQRKDCRVFSPNDETHPAFGEALRQADRAGVRILCYDCTVTEDALTADAPLPVKL